MKNRNFHVLAAALVVALAACDKSEGPSAHAAPSPSGASTAGPALEGRRVDIEASAEGYKPSTIEAKKGETLVLRFTRTTKSECLAEIMIPDHKIKKPLPLNQPVDIQVKLDKEGKVLFQCGMAMLKGTINVTGG